MRRRKVVAALAVAALGLGALAACGKDKPEAGGDKELTYWSMWKPGEDQQKVLQAAIEEFEKSTGIKVTVQWSGRDVLKQVAARLNAGDPPDLTDQDAGALQGNLGKVDGLTGLSDVYAATVAGDTKKVSDVIPQGLVKSYKTKDGQPFVVPYEVIGSTMWYNAAANPELATNPPKTWAEFIAVLDALKAKGRTPIALDGDIKFYDAYWTTWSIIRHGGIGLLPKAATDKTGATFDDPAFLKAAKDVEQLIKGGYIVKDFNGTKWPAQQNAWVAGKTPTDLLLMGTWAPSETGPQAASGFKHRSFPFPQVEGGKGNKAAEAGVIGFAIPKKAKHADAAKQFIAFFLNKDRLAKISTEAKNLTPRSDVPAPAELADYQKEVAAAGSELFLPYDDASAIAPEWSTNVWEPANADFFNGKLDAAGFIKKLKDETIKLGKQ
ncbi:MAG TPA: ABC transporter substrate-binding protein [Micromonosporaceae bacterium]|nr:ABC transporter substrate-binding protein [Micromonosporaceae bacterium]HCU52096.1 ABC transporter substrate-binding protein [Micromonosporaceae bacterium]